MSQASSCSGRSEAEHSVSTTPPVLELQTLIRNTSQHNYVIRYLDPLTEVHPRIYIGDVSSATNKRSLRELLITHILNAAHGRIRPYAGASFYAGTNIAYHGVEGVDRPSFDMSPFFYPAANFIRTALSMPTGKVLVHSARGCCRSPTLVLAYLMIHENMTLVEAIKAVGSKRGILPNPGFLEQLRQLDQQLHSQRKQQ